MHPSCERTPTCSCSIDISTSIFSVCVAVRGRSSVVVSYTKGLCNSWSKVDGGQRSVIRCGQLVSRCPKHVSRSRRLVLPPMRTIKRLGLDRRLHFFFSFLYIETMSILSHHLTTAHDRCTLQRNQIPQYTSLGSFLRVIF